MRDPWGQRELPVKGFMTNSVHPSWVDTLPQGVQEMEGRKASRDGSFWMTYEDFMEDFARYNYLFDFLHVNNIESPNTQSRGTHHMEHFDQGSSRYLLPGITGNQVLQ